MIKHGPVDVVMLSAREPKFDGKVLFELQKQVAAGTIRVLDGMVVVKDASGLRKTVDIEDLPPAESAKLGFVPGGLGSLFSSYDTEELYKEMEPGTAIMALAIEQTWAVPLLNNILEAGTELVVHTAIPAAVVDEAFASLEAPEEAEPKGGEKPA
ncbi:MAG TPA: DUF6325 family protein [Anaerolineales bacterium]|nr:DUF6325 family protein [Anaerolineales bacterium]